ncbi:MAG TPA: helix-turn-helix domain-containing protein [Pseudonocardia sp.]|jgi:excisionase family DNA binding protein|nr:helix-turn-helix domain-containing protein [Pseudonocardia sp.]
MTYDLGGVRHLPPLLTVSEVAKMLRVSKMTVYRLIEDKRLEAIKVRGSFRIPRDAVIQYLNP